MTAVARLRDETIRQIENAYRERADSAMRKLREESPLAHEDWREGQRIASEAGGRGTVEREIPHVQRDNGARGAVFGERWTGVHHFNKCARVRARALGGNRA
jgi:hypothetical protein